MPPCPRQGPRGKEPVTHAGGLNVSLSRPPLLDSKAEETTQPVVSRDINRGTVVDGLASGNGSDGPGGRCATCITHGMECTYNLPPLPRNPRHQNQPPSQKIKPKT